jgi:hypothetical protein
MYFLVECARRFFGVCDFLKFISCRLDRKSLAKVSGKGMEKLAVQKKRVNQGELIWE